MLGHGTQEYWIITLPYRDIGYRNTGLQFCYARTQNTGILDCDIAKLGNGTQCYWILTLPYWDKRQEYWIIMTLEYLDMGHRNTGL